MFEFDIKVVKADSSGYYFSKYVKNVKVRANNEKEAKEMALKVLDRRPGGSYDIWRLTVETFVPVTVTEKQEVRYEVGYVEALGSPVVETMVLGAKSAADAAGKFFHAKQDRDVVIVSVEAL